MKISQEIPVVNGYVDLTKIAEHIGNPNSIERIRAEEGCIVVEYEDDSIKAELIHVLNPDK